MGRHTYAYATINNTWEILWSTSYLLGNVDTGIREFAGMGYCVDDVQMVQTVELQLMMHKMIRQINHTNNSHK